MAARDKLPTMALSHEPILGPCANMSESARTSLDVQIDNPAIIKDTHAEVF
jgi:hypothetical protein